MIQRKFRLNGIGYASSPVTIEARLNGNIVYSGEIQTNADAPPPLPDHNVQLGVPMFTWTEDALFEGSWQLQLKMTNPVDFSGYMFITAVEATLSRHDLNYIMIEDPNNPGQWISNGPEIFALPYWTLENDDQGSWRKMQPITNVEIDGVPTGFTPTREWPGQPMILLRPQQTVNAVIHTLKGVVKLTT